MTVAELPGAFLASVLLLLFAAFLTLRTLERAQGSRAGALGLIFVVAGGLGDGWVAARSELQGTPLAEADLAPHGAPLTVPPHTGPVVLDLVGIPAHAAVGTSSRTGYVVVGRDGDHEVLRAVGAFEERWARQRVGRGVSVPALSADTEDRVILDPSTQPVSVALERVDGDLNGPVHAAVVPAPPSSQAVAAAGAGAAVVGAVIDTLAGGSTALATFGAFLGFFGWMSSSGLTPDADPRAAFLAAGVSFAAAALVGPGLRRVATSTLGVRAVRPS